VVESIVARASGAKGVLEIGPGAGVLTAPLCDTAERVVAVELDRRMVGVLAEVAPLAEVVEADVLKTDVASILQRLPEPRCVVSNMPYNITGPLLGKVTECRRLFRNAVLMMQKEVGDRVLARAGSSERGSLSVCMQLQFAIEKVCDAPAGAFYPPPKVDSIVLEFVPIEQSFDVDRVIGVVRTGFTQPRKTLANNLSSRLAREKVEALLTSMKLDVRVRPHQLTNEQWVALAESL